jgi:hypothetical protein
MKLILIAVLAVMSAGCAHRGAQNIPEEFVSVVCVVEAFDPESLVFYSPNYFPYDGRSRVSRVRAIKPAELAGQIFSIDLMHESEKKDEGFEDLRRISATVRFRMPAVLARNTEKQLVPVDVLKKEPNQSPEPTSGLRPAVAHL